LFRALGGRTKKKGRKNACLLLKGLNVVEREVHRKRVTTKMPGKKKKKERTPEKKKGSKKKITRETPEVGSKKLSEDGRKKAGQNSNRWSRVQRFLAIQTRGGKGKSGEKRKKNSK